MSISVDYADGPNGRSLKVSGSLLSPNEFAMVMKAISEFSRQLLAPGSEELPKFIGSEVQRGQAIEPAAPAPKGDEPTASAQATLASAAGEAQGRCEPASPSIEPFKTPAAKPAPSSVTREIVKSLWPERSHREIAKRAGVSVSRVYQIVKDLVREKQQAEASATIMSEESRERQTAEQPETQPPAASKPEASPEPTAGPATAATTQEPASAPETITLPEAAVEPDDAPAATPAPAINAGKPIVHADGITLYENALEFGVRMIDLTTLERSTLAVLLRAHPNPVGVEFIRRRAWPSSARREDSDHELSLVTKSLRERLPEIGLELRTIKGVGLCIAAMEAVAA